MPAPMTAILCLAEVMIKRIYRLETCGRVSLSIQHGSERSYSHQRLTKSQLHAISNLCGGSQVKVSTLNVGKSGVTIFEGSVYVPYSRVSNL